MINELEKLRSDLWGSGLLPKKELQESRFLKCAHAALYRTVIYLKYLDKKNHEKTPEKKIRT